MRMTYQQGLSHDKRKGTGAFYRSHHPSAVLAFDFSAEKGAVVRARDVLTYGQEDLD